MKLEFSNSFLGTLTLAGAHAANFLPMDGEKDGDPPATPPKDESVPDSNKTDGKQLTLTEKELQDKLDALASKIRSEERNRYERNLATEKEKAAQEEAKKNNDYKTLYESNEKKLSELENEINRLKQIEPLFKSSVENRLNALPDELKVLAPALDNLAAVDEFLTKSESIAKTLLAKKDAPNFKHKDEGNKKLNDTNTLNKQLGYKLKQA